jgi:hypothetical protein
MAETGQQQGLGSAEFDSDSLTLEFLVTLVSFVTSVGGIVTSVGGCTSVLCVSRGMAVVFRRSVKNQRQRSPPYLR